MADGGGDLTVVSVVLFVVDRDVESVTMACAITEVIENDIAMPAQNLFIIIVV